MARRLARGKEWSPVPLWSPSRAFEVRWSSEPQSAGLTTTPSVNRENTRIWPQRQSSPVTRNTRGAFIADTVWVWMTKSQMFWRVKCTTEPLNLNNSVTTLQSNIKFQDRLIKNWTRVCVICSTLTRTGSQTQNGKPTIPLWHMPCWSVKILPSPPRTAPSFTPPPPPPRRYANDHLVKPVGNWTGVSNNER